MLVAPPQRIGIGSNGPTPLPLSSGGNGSSTFRAALAAASDEDGGAVPDSQPHVNGTGCCKNTEAAQSPSAGAPNASDPAPFAFHAFSTLITPSLKSPVTQAAQIAGNPVANILQTDNPSEASITPAAAHARSVKRQQDSKDGKDATAPEHATAAKRAPVNAMNTANLPNGPAVPVAPQSSVSASNDPSEASAAAGQPTGAVAQVPIPADGTAAVNDAAVAFGVKIQTAHQDKGFRIAVSGESLPIKVSGPSSVGGLKTTSVDASATSPVLANAARNGHGNENSNANSDRQHPESQGRSANHLNRPSESGDTAKPEAVASTNEGTATTFSRGQLLVPATSAGATIESSQSDSTPGAPSSASIDGPHPVVDANTQSSGPVVRNVSIQVEGERGQAIEIRIGHRAGELNVDVRSGDTDLTQKLRQNLGDLENRLGQSGYKADTWHPGATETRQQQNQTQTRSLQHNSQGDSQSNAGGQQQKRGTGHQRNNQEARQRVNGLRFKQMFSPEFQGAATNGIGS